MKPKIGDLVFVKEDIYIDCFLVPCRMYQVMGYQDHGSVEIDSDEFENGGDPYTWRGEIVLIHVENEEDQDGLTEWWIPFRKDICDFYKIPKRELQLEFAFSA